MYYSIPLEKDKTLFDKNSPFYFEKYTDNKKSKSGWIYSLRSLLFQNINGCISDTPSVSLGFGAVANVYAVAP